MELEVKIQLLKFCFHIVNSIFLVLGVSVAACAVWILFDVGSLLSVLPSDDLHTVGAGLLLIGGLVLLVSVIGCAGANGERTLLLVVYLGFLIVLLLGQLFVTLLLLLNTNKIGRSLEEMVDDMIHQYGQNFSSQDRLMNNIQTYGQCCGRTGPSDWFQDVNRTDVLPCSCFNVSRTSFSSAWCSEELIGPGGSFYEEGCQQKIRVMLQENVLTIAVMDFGLIFMQVAQFPVVLYLRRVIGRKAAVKGTGAPDDSDHAHLDPAPEEDSDIPVQNYDYINPEESSRDPTLPYYHDNQNYN